MVHSRSATLPCGRCQTCFSCSCDSSMYCFGLKPEVLSSVVGGLLARGSVFLALGWLFLPTLAPTVSAKDVKGDEAIQPGFEQEVVESVAEIMAREERLGDADLISPNPANLRKGTKLLPQAPEALFTSRWPFMDQSLQVQFAAADASESPFAVGVSFEGVQYSDSGKLPPDPMGAAGPTQFLVCVNGRIRVFSKEGILGPLNATTDNFFSSLTSNRTSDPRVRYDRLSGRWFIVMIEVPSNRRNNKVLIAVSNGSIITSATSFKFYSFIHSSALPAGDKNLFADYPTLGIDRNALYIGVNLFDSAGTTFSGSTGFVIKKATLLAGTLAVTAFRSLASSSGPGPYTPQGVDNDDPAATEGYFVGVDNITKGRLVMRRVSTPGGTPTISANLNIAVPATLDALRSVPSRGAPVPLDALDDRLVSARIQNGRLWTAHHIQVDATGAASPTGGRNGARWYEITNLAATPQLRQSGTLFDPAAAPSSYWFPSCAASGQGHMALGCSVAGPNQYAEIAVAGRLASDPLGVLRPPLIAQSSTTSYDLGTDVPRRWGDFSITTLDPNDNMTIWTVQQYCNALNSWGVRVVQLRAPPPVTPLACNPPSVPPGATNVNVVVTGLSNGGSGFYDPGPDFTNRISAAVSGLGVVVNRVTYVDPTTVTLNISVASSAPEAAASLTVINPDGQTASSSVGVLTVEAANKAPTISDILDQSVSEDLETPAIRFTVGDKETPAGNLVVTASSSNLDLVPNENIGFGGTGTDRTLAITPAPDQFGTATITVAVTDAGGKRASDTFALVVSSINDAPTLDALPDLSLDEDAPPRTISLTGIGAGAANENQTLAVQASSSNPGLFADLSIAYTSPSPTGTLTFSPAPNASGAAIVTVTVDDGQTLNHATSRAFLVTVNAVNDLPSISDVGDVVAPANLPVDTAFTIGDIETAANDLVVRGTSSNPQLVPDSNIIISASGSSRIVRLTPRVNESGTALITLTVSDQDGGTASDTFSLRVDPENALPTLTDLPDEAIDEDTPAAVTFSVGDAETATADLVVTASSTNPALVPNANFNIVGSGAVRTLTIVPGTNESGIAKIRVSVADAQGATVTKGFTLTVKSVNDLPTISDIYDQTITEGTAQVEYAFTIGDVDTPLENLHLIGTSLNETLVRPEDVSFTGTGASRKVVLRPLPDQFGKSLIVVVLAENDDNFEYDTFELTVLPVNHAPSVSMGPDVTILEDAGRQRFSNWATDITAGPASESSQVVQFRVANDNDSLFSIPPSITPEGLLSFTPAPNASGEATIQVALQDDGGTANGGADTSLTQSFTISVLPVNDAPVLAPIADRWISPGRPLLIANVATDIDSPAEDLAFSLIDPPLGAEINPSSGLFSWVPSEAQNGTTNIIRVVVSDGGTPGMSDAKSFKVTVADENLPPVLSSVPDQEVHAGSAVRVIISAIDPDGPESALVFTLVNAPVGAVIEPAKHAFAWTPTDDQVGVSEIVLEVRDAGIPSQSATESFKITVVPRPTVKIALAGPRLILSWSAIPGKAYRVQYKDGLDDAAWKDLPGDVIADGADVEKEDDSFAAGSQRFYRILCLP